MTEYYGKYNPTSVIFTISPPTGALGVAVPVPGFAGLAIASGRGADSFIDTDRTNPTFTVTVGVDGDVTHTRSNDKTAPLTLVLMDGSGFNNSISLLHNAQEDEDVPHFTVQVTVTDLNATPPSSVTAEHCVVERPAPFSRGAAAGENTWTFLPAATNVVHTGRQF